MRTDLLSLPPRDRAGALRVVVESPAGSHVKLAYTRDVGFVLARPLVWGEPAAADVLVERSRRRR